MNYITPIKFEIFYKVELKFTICNTYILYVIENYIIKTFKMQFIENLIFLKLNDGISIFLPSLI